MNKVASQGSNKHKNCNYLLEIHSSFLALKRLSLNSVHQLFNTVWLN